MQNPVSRDSSTFGFLANDHLQIFIAPHSSGEKRKYIYMEYSDIWSGTMQRSISIFAVNKHEITLAKFL